MAAVKAPTLKPECRMCPEQGGVQVRCSYPCPTKHVPLTPDASTQRGVFSHSPKVPYPTGNPSPGFRIPPHHPVCYATLDNSFGICPFGK